MWTNRYILAKHKSKSTLRTCSGVCWHISLLSHTGTQALVITSQRVAARSATAWCVLVSYSRPMQLLHRIRNRTQKQRCITSLSWKHDVCQVPTLDCQRQKAILHLGEITIKARPLNGFRQLLQGLLINLAKTDDPAMKSAVRQEPKCASEVGMKSNAKIQLVMSLRKASSHLHAREEAPLRRIKRGLHWVRQDFRSHRRKLGRPGSEGYGDLLRASWLQAHA